MKSTKKFRWWHALIVIAVAILLLKQGGWLGALVGETYQEDADSYSYSAGWYSYVDGNDTMTPVNLLDGDWNTYASLYDWSPSTYTIYINYTKPVDATGAEWRIKDGNLGGDNRYDLTNCWNYSSDKLILKITGLWPSRSSCTVNYYCGNTVIATNPWCYNLGPEIYEEGVYWSSVQVTHETIEAENYQEDADAYSGSPQVEDGYWDTAGGEAFQEVYVIPEDASGAILMYKDASNMMKNITIPEVCIDQPNNWTSQYDDYVGLEGNKLLAVVFLQSEIYCNDLSNQICHNEITGEDYPCLGRIDITIEHTVPPGDYYEAGVFWLYASCGDGTCNGEENCTTCSGDCGACPSSGGGGGGSTPKPKEAACEPEWDCTPWSACKLVFSTRTCKDTNKCPGLFDRPSGSKWCTPFQPVEQGEKEAEKEIEPSFLKNYWWLLLVAAAIGYYIYKKKKGRK